MRPRAGASGLGVASAAGHVAILSALAFAQPVLDLLGRNPTFFVAHRAAPADIALVALVLAAVPPILVLLLIGAVGAPTGHWRGALYVAVAILVTLVVLPPLHRAAGPLPAWAVVAGAAAIGCVLALAYARIAVVRSFLTVLTPAVIVFPLIFLLDSPVSRLMRSEKSTAAAATGARNAPPIVFVVFDGLSLTSLSDASGTIDAVRYPAFARLSRMSTWYRDTTTVADLTQLAVPAILTGRYPQPTREVPTAVDHPENLFTLLAGLYGMNVHESLTELCPRWLCGAPTREPLGQKVRTFLGDVAVIYAHFLLPPTLRTRLPSIEGQWRDFGVRVERVENAGFAPKAMQAAVDRGGAFERFDAAVVRRPRPTLHFIHSLLPHSPFVYLPTGRRYPAPSKLAGLGGAGWGRDGAAVEVAEQRYLLQVGFVDRLLGRLLDRLEEAGLLDEALLIVTADHGCAFLPGQPYRTVTLRNFHDVAVVPLFIKEPGQRDARRRDQPLQTIDILPTVAALAGVDLAWTVDGRSALTPGQHEGRMIVRQTGTTWPVPARATEWDHAVARRIARFGAGEPWATMLTRGVRAELIGIALDGTALGEPAPYTVSLWDGMSRDMRVNGAVPAYVEGELLPRSDAARDPPIVAIAINGTIGATARTHRTGRALAFQALVAETLLRPGKNEYDVLVVDDGDPARPRLAPVRPEP